MYEKVLEYTSITSKEPTANKSSISEALTEGSSEYWKKFSWFGSNKDKSFKKIQSGDI